MTKDYMKYKKTLVEMKIELEKQWGNPYKDVIIGGQTFQDPLDVLSIISNYVSVCESLQNNTNHFRGTEEDE